MRALLWVSLFVFCGVVLAEDPALEPIVMGVDTNRSLVVPGLIRAAVANSKFVKARAVPPDRLLLTGKQPGKTMVRVWARGDLERSFWVTVLSPSLYETSVGRGPDEVVKVALELVEVNTSDSDSYGIHWPDVIEASASATVQGAVNTTGIHYVASVRSAKGWIEQLVSRGWARTLAKPNLYVRLGEAVTFHAGGEFPVTALTEKYGLTHRSTEWKSFGMTAKIKPESGDLVNLNSDIEIEISERDLSANVDGVPSLTKRTLKTKMNSRHGETVILTGLIRTLESRTREGTPILSSIPLLGWIFFSRNRNSSQNSEVLMAMTLSFKTRLSQREELEAAVTRLGEEGGP